MTTHQGAITMHNVAELSRKVNTEARQAPKKAKPVCNPQEDYGDEWYLHAQTTSKGAMQSNYFNCILALRNDSKWKGRLRFNAMSRQVELDGKDMREDDYSDILEWLQLMGINHASMESARRAVSRVATENAYNPLLMQLESYAWDGVPRLDTWLETYMGAKPETDDERKYISLVGRWFLIGMCKRALQPGCQVDTAPIFEGNQGTRKTSALRILGGEWFSEHLPNDVSSKEASHHLRGKWLVELSELSAMKKSDVESMKSFMTRPVEDYRAAYARNPEKEPRTCVFAGTTNSLQYLKDPSGDRRFWPVQTGEIDLEALRRDRENLLAEAFACACDNERHWPEGDERRLFEAKQAERQEEDPWDAKVAEYLVGKETTTIQAIGNDALFVQIGRQDRAMLLRISGILRRQGWNIVKRASTGNVWGRGL